MAASLQGLWGLQQSSQQMMNQYNSQMAQSGYMNSLGSPAAEALRAMTNSPVEDVKVADMQTIPDVSLTRVLKWAVVLLVAMGLGKRVWALFGDKITAQVHKAIGEGV